MVLNLRVEASSFALTRQNFRRDVILYALGVGVADPAFSFEDHEDFAPLPTYPLVMAFKGVSQDVVPFGVGE